MQKELDHKVAFVTGAGSGIGWAIAEKFAECGAKVVIADINGGAAENAAEMLTRQGFTALAVPCDVTDESQVETAIEHTVSAYGRLDILVNNAGIQFVSNLEDFPTDKFEQLIRIMLIGPFIATKKVFPIMKKQKFGRIINMASINGLIGFAGKAAYNSAKHGVIGLTKVAALEGATHGITVNALCPGYVDTPLVQNQLQDLAKTRNVPLEKVVEEVLFPLVPQHRLLEPEEIAAYAVFLASDQAKGVTGQAVVIDGGYTAQ